VRPRAEWTGAPARSLSAVFDAYSWSGRANVKTKIEVLVPDHRLAWGWVTAFLVVPPLVGGVLRVEGVPALLLGIAWFVIAVPVTVISFLDWSRRASFAQSRAGRAWRAAARVPAVVLGTVALLMGVGAPMVLARTGSWTQPGFWWFALFMACFAFMGWSLLCIALSPRRRREPGPTNRKG
jgi:hypothetical protein